MSKRPVVEVLEATLAELERELGPTPRSSRNDWGLIEFGKASELTCGEAPAHAHKGTPEWHRREERRARKWTFINFAPRLWEYFLFRVLESDKEV